MQLRSYQEAALAAVADKKRALVVMPCGAGKSLTFATMIQRAKKPLSVVAMPSRPLVEQFDRDYLHTPLLGKWKSLLVCSSQGGTTDSREIRKFLNRQGCKVVAVTYDSFLTLTKQLRKTEKIDLLVWDEAHNLTTATRAKLLRGYLAESETFWTATPKRTVHLDLYQWLAFTYTAKQALEDGVCRRVEIKVFATHGDKKLSEVDMLAHAAVAKVKHAGFCNMLTFHGTVAEVERFASDEFVAAFTGCVTGLHPIVSICVQGITSETSKPERAKILKEFDRVEQGRIYLLASCRVLREGIDLRHANAEVPFASTSDLTRATQLMGRIMRGGHDSGWLVLPAIVDVDAWPKGVDETKALKAALKQQKCNDAFRQVLETQGVVAPKNQARKKQVANPNPKKRGPNKNKRKVLQLTIGKSEEDVALVTIGASMVAPAPLRDMSDGDVEEILDELHGKEVESAANAFIVCCNNGSGNAGLDEFVGCLDECERCCAFRARLETIEGRRKLHLRKEGVWKWMGMLDMSKRDRWLLCLLSAEADMDAAPAKAWLRKAWLTTNDNARNLLRAHGEKFASAYDDWNDRDIHAILTMIEPVQFGYELLPYPQSPLEMRALECVLETNVLRPTLFCQDTQNLFYDWTKRGALRTSYQACLWAHLGMDVSDFPLAEARSVWKMVSTDYPDLSTCLRTICHAHLFQRRSYQLSIAKPLREAIARARLLAGPHTNAVMDRLGLGKEEETKAAEERAQRTHKRRRKDQESPANVAKRPHNSRSSTVTCPMCTFANPADRLGCEMCGTPIAESSTMPKLERPCAPMSPSSAESDEEQYKERMSRMFLDLLQRFELQGNVVLLETQLLDRQNIRYVCNAPHPSEADRAFTGNLGMALNDEWAKVKFCGGYFGLVEYLHSALEALFSQRRFDEEVFVLGLTTQDPQLQTWLRVATRTVREIARKAGFVRCERAEDVLDEVGECQFEKTATQFYLCYKQ